MTTDNFVFLPGTILVYPGGGSAPVPVSPAVAANLILKSSLTFPFVEWGTVAGTGTVVGPVSAVDGNLASYNGTTGQILEDSGIAAATVASGPGTSTAHNLAGFAGTDGITLEDSGIPADLVVAGPASAVSGNLAAFNGASGQSILDSGIPLSGVIQVIKTVPVDMTAAAATAIFTPAAAFVVTQIVAVLTSVTGSVTPPTVNLGFTAAAYNDFVSVLTLDLAALHDTEQLIVVAATAALAALPAATPLFVNVTGADTTASVDLTRFDVIGYYI